MLTTVAVHRYRSLRDLRIALGRITLITGANGTGKTSLYRALRLLADCADGSAVSSLAREGGLPSTLWAGPAVIGRSVREGAFDVQGLAGGGPPVSLGLGFAAEEFSYLIDLGLPQRLASAFDLDPEIKRELVWAGELQRPASLLVRRKGGLVEVRDGRGWQPVTASLRPYESMLTEVIDPERAPELIALREQLRSWRFYDHFRTDRDAPARRPQIGTRTPVLAHDGADLAAALQTIVEIGDAGTLRETIGDAFPGSSVSIESDAGLFSLRFRGPGLLRPLGAAELSDGTLRYLLLVAALLSPRPPGLMVLNEPETSLHPELLPALARLIRRASRDVQIIVVSHSAGLLEALRDGATNIELVKELGETRIPGLGAFDGPPWSWGSR